MRLIGIQALLGLLQHKISAKANAHGTGSGAVAISNAGVVGSALGIGSISAVGVAIGAVSGVGFADAFAGVNGIGAGTGLFIGVGAAAGHGTSAVKGANNVIGGAGLAIGSGVAVGKPASAGAASGTGTASAVGFAAGVVTSIGSAAGTGAATSGAVNDFLARTSGLDSTHTTAYTNLINGLVSDGIWSKLDVLYIFATSGTSNALLNLRSTNFTGVVHGSPTFATDRGYTGTDGGTTIWIDTGFNPTTATSPQFVTNSCHVSVWGVTNVLPSVGGKSMGVTGSGGASQDSGIFPRFNDNKSYFRINDATSSAGFTNAGSSSIGHWTASRTGASASVGYLNASVVGSPNAAAGTLQNVNFYVLAENRVGFGVAGGSSVQYAMASIGSGLTATDVTNFYNRLRTYMSAVGVP